jgi:glycosyltransferase involved in cell wall biosynthesis
MAASRPVVASPIGVNCDVVKEGVNGFFAVSEDEWVTNLERFQNDMELTAQLGANARETVETSFSLSATVPRIAEILESAANLRRKKRRTPSRAAIRSGLARSVESGGAVPSR